MESILRTTVVIGHRHIKSLVVAARWWFIYTVGRNRSSWQDGSFTRMSESDNYGCVDEANGSASVNKSSPDPMMLNGDPLRVERLRSYNFKWRWCIKSK